MIIGAFIGWLLSFLVSFAITVAFGLDGNISFLVGIVNGALFTWAGLLIGERVLD